MNTTYVCGHRNPDTDSIVSAIAYASLMNALGDNGYVPARLGHLNDESAFLLKRFGFEPEITAKLAKMKDVRICEVPISYYGRRFSEGKKIGWKDGFRAIHCILKYNIFSRKYLK